MLLCLLFWRSKPFCNFRLCLPNVFPPTLPLPLYSHHSCLLYSYDVTFANWSHYRLSKTKLCDDDDVTFAPVSLFWGGLKMCILCVLACCSPWSLGVIKSMLKKGMQLGGGMIRRGLLQLESCGTFVGGSWGSWSLLSLSVVNVVAVNVLMLILFFKSILARNVFKRWNYRI